MNNGQNGLSHSNEKEIALRPLFSNKMPALHRRIRPNSSEVDT